jgi:hypothetical protein
MLRLFCFLLLLSSLSIKAQNSLVREKSALMEYEMNANGQIALQLNIWASNASDLFLTTYFTLSQPANIILTIDTTRSRWEILDTCGEFIAKYVYRSAFFDPSPYLNGGTAIDFELAQSYLSNDVTDNMVLMTISTRLRLIPHQNNSGQWVLDSTGTVNTPMYAPLAYPKIGKTYTMTLAPKILGPGMDSVSIHLRPWEVGFSFKSGYSYINPVPDRSESLLNGDNVFSQQQKSFTFEINTSAGLPQIPFESALPLRYEYHSQNAVFAEALTQGYVNLSSAADSSSAVTVYDFNGQFSAINNRMTRDTIVLWYGDSLQLDLTTIKAGVNLQWDLDFNGIHAGMGPANDTTWQSGQFSSLNTNGNFLASALSKARFSWAPGSNNYFLGPKTFKLIFTVRHGNCASLKERTLELVVHLKMPLRIFTSHGNEIDTITACEGQLNSTNLMVPMSEDTTSFYWSPGYIFGGRDSAFQYFPYFDSLVSGYIYIRRFSDSMALDSVYIKNFPTLANLYSLNNNGAFLYLPDSLDDFRSWSHNGLHIAFNKKDSLPILGSGTYRAWYNRGDICPTPSDSSWVEGKFFAANYDHRDSIYTFTTALNGQDSVFRLNFAEPNLSIFLREINLLQVTNTSTQFRTLDYRFGDSSGIIIQDTLRIAPQQYFHFEQILIEKALTANHPYYLEIRLSRDLSIGAYQDISFPQEIRVSRPMDFLSFEKGKGSASLIPDQRPFAVGLVFDNFVGNPEAVENAWNIYPNPAQDYLQVESLNQEGKLFTISDLQGRIIQSGNLQSNGRIDLNNLAKGSYIFHLANHYKILIQQ